jgi:hypothetical protein
MDDQGKAGAEPTIDRAEAKAKAQRAAKQKAIVMICDLIGVVTESARSMFVDELNVIANAYRLDLDVAPLYGRPKGQRAALRALQKSASETIDRMNLISAEYTVQLDAMLTPTEAHPYSRKSLMLAAQNLLPRLELAIDRFDRSYAPKLGRPTDVPFEDAVRSLIDLIVEATGQKPLVKQNKTIGAAPEFGSPEAKAIAEGAKIDLTLRVQGAVVSGCLLNGRAYFPELGSALSFDIALE